MSFKPCSPQLLPGTRLPILPLLHPASPLSLSPNLASPPSLSFTSPLTVWQIDTLWCEQHELASHMDSDGYRLAVGAQHAAVRPQAEAAWHWQQVGAQQRAINGDQRPATHVKAGTHFRSALCLSGV